MNYYKENIYGERFTYEEYRSFLFDEENEYNCEECPENDGRTNGGRLNPCGQCKCWVTIHNPKQTSPYHKNPLDDDWSDDDDDDYPYTKDGEDYLN